MCTALFACYVRTVNKHADKLCRLATMQNVTDIRTDRRYDLNSRPYSHVRWAKPNANVDDNREKWICWFRAIL